MKDLGRGDVFVINASTVLIVDDHKMVCESLSRLFEEEDGFHVIGMANDVQSAVTIAQSNQPDLAIVDFHLPDGDGVTTGERILGVSNSTKLLMLTGEPSEKVFSAAIEAGFKGFILKEKAAKQLIDGAKCLVNGGVCLPQEMIAGILPKMKKSYQGIGSDLTTREIDILRYLSEGSSPQHIAEHLFISIHTVRNHIQNILTKLGVHSQLQAIAIAHNERIIPR